MKCWMAFWHPVLIEQDLQLEQHWRLLLSKSFSESILNDAREASMRWRAVGFCTYRDDVGLFFPPWKDDNNDFKKNPHPQRKSVEWAVAGWKSLFCALTSFSFNLPSNQNSSNHSNKECGGGGGDDVEVPVRDQVLPSWCWGNMETMQCLGNYSCRFQLASLWHHQSDFIHKDIMTQYWNSAKKNPILFAS